jgi:hypothetical protein
MVGIDALLAAEPSPAVFRALLDELAALEPGELAAALARVARGLAAWPDALRCAGEQILVDEGIELHPSAVLVRKLAFEPSHGGCSPELVVALARAPELAELTILDLFAEDVDDAGAAAIAASDTLVRLRELRLGQRLSDTGFLALAHTTKLPMLERLHLSGTLGEDETALALADAPLLAKLVELQWDEDGLTDEGLWALGMSRWLRPALRADFLAALEPEQLRERACSRGLEDDTLDDDELIDTLSRTIDNP